MANQQNKAMELYNEYVDCTQDLPLDIQRQITQMRNFDLEFHQMMTEVNELTESFKGNVSSANVAKLTKLLVHGLDIGDRKVLTMQKTSDLVEDKLISLERCNKEYLTSIKEPEVSKLRIKDKQKASSYSKERCLPSASTSTATKELKNRSTDNEPKNGKQISKQLQRNRADEPDYKDMSDDKVLISSLNRPTPLPRTTATAQTQSHVTFKQTTQKTEKPTKKKRKYKKKQKDNYSPSTDDDEEIPVDLKKSTKKKRKYRKKPKDSSPSTDDYEEIPVDLKKPTKIKRKYRKKPKDSSPSTDDYEEIPVDLKKPTKKKHKYRKKPKDSSPLTDDYEESPVDPGKQTKQKRKYKKQQKDNSPSTDDDEEIPVDPDEPTYCLCDQISYGEMICCDNDLCPLEWFHFSCVSLLTKPKGKWFCPKCRGDRYNIMKPKAEFLKELERYNKEKEDQA